MEPSEQVVEGLRAFYEAFGSHDANVFADVIAVTAGVSVIGTAPGEGHGDRDSWIEAYRQFIAGLGLRLEGGPTPAGFADGNVGFALDEPRFVLPDGSFLPTRLTAVMSHGDRAWKVVHLHFSVGVPDEQAIQAAGAPWPAPGE